MKKSKIHTFLLPICLVLFALTLIRIDRIFFKRNCSFCIRFIHSSVDNRPEWEVPPPSQEEETLFDQILKQKFRYLAKGCHCYAFVSEDNKYVIKFHRYASHLRLFPWLNHPFSYKFSDRRKAISEHNIQKLKQNIQSYLNCAQDLKHETGLIYLHINHTDHLKRKVTLIDATQAEYQVDLDKVTFILQHKADLIYPTIDRMLSENNIDGAKQIVSAVINLIADCCMKGYIDEDPILRKNYGVIGNRAIHIDLGDLVKNEKIHLKENYFPHIKEITESLRIRIEKHYPVLTSYFIEELEKFNLDPTCRQVGRTL